MEILIAIATKIAEYTVEPVGQWLCYPLHYSNNIGSMKNQLDMLGRARERVQHSIDAATSNGEEIEGDVNKWLEEVDKNIEEARKVLEGEEAKMKCSNGACLNLKLRHQLSQKAKKIANDIGEVLKKGSFDRVSYHIAPQGMLTTSCTYYMASESRMSTMKRLMEALRDDNIHVIGVWGMAGVGKSTLVREVANQAKEEKLFDEVAMANVTHSPYQERIQGEIADMLDLKFDKETELGRASRLRERLTKTKDKKILVILDDIWEKLDLEAIGIPSEGCKVLLASRNRDVLVCEMRTQKDFGLKVLPEEESWSLFKKMAGDCVEHPNLRCIATEVAKECAGLPLALVTVSSALKDKELFEWKDALLLLRRPAPDHLKKMQSTIYSSIELSYKHLENKEVQYVFLLCAQQDYYIHEMDLLKYCYGLDLFHGINTMEDARNRLSTILRSLNDCCLLLQSPYSSKIFRMHDIVGDAAKLIASRKDHNMFVIRVDGELKELPDADVLKRCEAFSILGGDIHELPNEMKCPKLKFLHVSCDENCPMQISDAFFERMRKLKVLDWTKMQLSLLPSSLRLLRNLQTLCLDQCVMGNIAIIGELKNLKILSLLKSNISQLPREIGLLTRLRLLDLSDCSKLEVIPPNVLSSLVVLEELYMGNSFVKWEAEGLNNERNNASLAELKHLSHLITLEIHIQDANNLPKDLSFEKLGRYIIFVGDVWDWSDRRRQASRTLKLKMNTSFQLAIGIKILLRRTENLYLDQLKGVNSILHELDSEGFQQLKHLHIQNNPEIKYIINSRMHLIAFPALETFLLKNMMGLEEICHGQLSSTSFANLRVVKVKQCDKLKFVFPSSIVRRLSQLEELEIRECSIMGAIVMKEEGDIEDEDTLNLFSKLRCLALEHLPKFMSLLTTQNSLVTDTGEIISEGKLDFHMPILHEQVLFPKLESLQLFSIGLEDIQHNQDRATRSSCILANMQSVSRFPNLLHLEVHGFGNIKYLLSFSIARFMVQLKYLYISECKVMEEILVTKETIPKELFPRLECLVLKELPMLKRFCEGSNIKFPSLKLLAIDNCPKLKTFISKPTSLGMTTSKELKEMNAEDSPQSHTAVQPLFNEEVAFPSLEQLTISHINELKIIWQNQFAVDSFCKLQGLKVEFCETITNVFPFDMLARFQSLKVLILSDCGSLQEVFELQGLNVQEIHDVTVIPLETLHLTRLPKMKHVWNKDPQKIFSFPNLKDVRTIECESLKSSFPASVARCLMQLENLHIVACGVEEIVEREEGAEAITRFVFPQVSYLSLVLLPRLKCFYPGRHASEWPMLKDMLMGGCHEVDIFASQLLSETLQDSQLEISDKQALFLVHEVGFPSLEKLTISHMDDLKIIWRNQFAVNSFYKLQHIKVEFCEKLTNVFQFDMLARFQSLKELIVSDCGSLQEVFELQRLNVKETRAVTVIPLEKLHLTRLPKMNHVWNKDPQKIFSFQNLKDIHAIECESLKSFFPASVAKCLMQLEVLHIVDCGVEEIVEGEEGAEAITRFVFPQVSHLHLDRLPKLKCFYPGRHASEWPMLKDLAVGGFHEVDIFACELLSGTLEESQLEISDKQSLFLVDEVGFPSLEKLTISHVDDLKIIWPNQFAVNSFYRLQHIEVEFCENLTNIFQFDMLARFQSLKVLSVSDCGSLQEVFELQGLNVKETHAVTVIPLEKLHLTRLPQMNHVWNSDPQEFFSFRNLKDIHAIECESLKSFFPASVAKCLLRLEDLHIVDCGVEEIVEGEEGAEAITRFVFPQVSHLHLDRLPKLKCFYPGRHASEWPMLKDLVVGGFHEVDIFAYEILSETLQESQLEISDKQSPFFVDEVLLPKLEGLQLSSIGLEDIQHNQDRATSSSSILANMRSASRFPNLLRLEVQGFGNIKYLLSFSTARYMVQLKHLHIFECKVMEEILVTEETIPKVLFPRLECLFLKELPILKRFCEGSNIKFPSLKYLIIKHCPKLKTFISKPISLGVTTSKELKEMNAGESPHTAVQPLFNEEVVFPNSESLQLSSIGLEDIQHNQRRATRPSCRLENMQSTSSFQNLSNLVVKGSNNIKYLLSFSTARYMVQLKGLHISECKVMEEILVTEDLGVVEEIPFPPLEILILKELPILERFCQGSNIKFPSLKKLEIDNCPKLKTFISKPVSLGMMTSCKELKEMNADESPHTAMQPLFNEEVVFPNLERLQLSSIGLEDIHWATWSSCRLDIQSTSRFQNLLELEVKGCGNIKYLLSFSTAEFMVQLKGLQISECKAMEEILLTEDLGVVEEIIPKVLFPRLEGLLLKELPILKRFCQGSNIKFPSLKDLVIDHCPKLKTFIFKPVISCMTTSKELKEMNTEESPHTVVQPLFNEEVAFPSLERLLISHMDDLKIIWRNQFAMDSFYKLQGVKVEFCKNLVNVFQSDMLARFQSLEELFVVHCGSLEEVFELEGLNVTETHAITTIQLKKLHLEDLPSMRHVWSKDPKQIFSFQKLQRVLVLQCWSLKSLFPASVATCLTQLEDLRISLCVVLEEIVAGEEAAQQIARFVFPQVIVLHLAMLPRLKWFYPGVHTSEWPMLKYMLVADCPKVEIFASELSSFQDILLGESKLDIPIKQPLFLVNEAPFPSLEKLRIAYMFHLKIIWHSQFTADSFCKPQTIKVEFCENLIDQETCVVTPTQLKELHLIHLPKLKHIWNKEPQQIVSFPDAEEDFREIGRFLLLNNAAEEIPLMLITK